MLSLLLLYLLPDYQQHILHNIFICVEQKKTNDSRILVALSISAEEWLCGVCNSANHWAV